MLLLQYVTVIVLTATVVAAEGKINFMHLPSY